MFKEIYARVCFFAILTCLPLCAHAYDFYVDGIYYNVLSSSSSTVSVTYESSSYNSYSGTVDIPETVTFGDVTYDVTRIGSNAFRECTNLASVTISVGVTSIGASAFYCCTSLTSINIPSSVTTIGAHAFYDCTGLTSIEIPSSVTAIGTYAFYDCI